MTQVRRPQVFRRSGVPYVSFSRFAASARGGSDRESGRLRVSRASYIAAASAGGRARCGLQPVRFAKMMLSRHERNVPSVYFFNDRTYSSIILINRGDDHARAT